MKLLILGATGGTGIELVKQALARGHEVTAFVRSPEKIVVLDPHLKVVHGDARSSDQVSNVIPGHDAVLSAIGSRDLRVTDVRAECTRNTIDGMLHAKVGRFLLVSTALLFPDLGPIGALLRYFIFQHVVRDSKAAEEVVCASSLNWTIVRPPRLINGPRRLRSRFEIDRLPVGGSRIARANVAEFVLDLAEQQSHLREIVGVAW